LLLVYKRIDDAVLPFSLSVPVGRSSLLAATLFARSIFAESLYL
jgi:hypothetical protein